MTAENRNGLTRKPFHCKATAVKCVSTKLHKMQPIPMLIVGQLEVTADMEGPHLVFQRPQRTDKTVL
jgi:hypothetical protein